jgi:hypothetical protein
MSESDWLEQKRNVLNRLLDAAFERGQGTDEEASRDVHRLSPVKKHSEVDEKAGSQGGGQN